MGSESLLSVRTSRREHRYLASRLGFYLIVLNVVIHVLGLGVINERIVASVSHRVSRLHLTPLFVVIMAGVTLMVTVLHAIEGTVWAGAYLGVGALPDIRTAMLYSLSAITSYGHTPIFLDPHWQMLGALEALNGSRKPGTYLRASW